MASIMSFDWGALKAKNGDRTYIGRFSIIVLAALLVVVMAFSITSGASDASVWNLISALFGNEGAISSRDYTIITAVRLPRMLLGMFIGAGLAVSGLIMQGLFRNPLADPGLVGVSAGASLGAVSIIVIGGTVLAPLTALLGIYSLQIFAFLGGLATTFTLYIVATRSGQTAMATMLLAGIAIAAFAGAITGVFIYVANDAQLRDVTFWGLGSLAGSNWTKVWASLPIIGAAIVGALFLSDGLNRMALGEASARHLGLDIQRFKISSIVIVAAATGASVAVSGGIGFVGIVVPHILRLIIGPNHKYLIPASILLGASFLLIADAVARTIVAPAELPIGIITAAVGGPFFLWVLLTRRNRIAW